MQLSPGVYIVDEAKFLETHELNKHKKLFAERLRLYLLIKNGKL